MELRVVMMQGALRIGGYCFWWKDFHVSWALAGVMVFFVLPDSPEKERFLNEDDKLVARAREVRQVGDQEAHRVGGINFKDVGLALMDPKVCFTTSRRWNLKIPSYTSQNYPD
jgi:hypothetical protein